jgi:small subunit ribosomal protein S33
LRQRLKGPILAQYYPPRIRPIQELRRAFPQFDFTDEAEESRLEGVEARKKRGKGAPKKKKTREEGKQFSKRKPGKAVE